MNFPSHRVNPEIVFIVENLEELVVGFEVFLEVFLRYRGSDNKLELLGFEIVWSVEPENQILWVPGDGEGVFDRVGDRRITSNFIDYD